MRKVSLSLWAAGLLGGAIAFNPATVRASLVHEYTFNPGTVNGTTVDDTVGSANGTLTGGATISNGQLVTTGPHGDGVALPATATSGITGDFTIEQWFTRADQNAVYSSLFGISTDQSHFLIVNPERPNNGNNSLSADFDTGSGEANIVSGVNPTQGTEHMIAVTYSAGSQVATLYYDGSSVGTPLNIGAFNLSTINGNNGNTGINDFSPYPDPSFAGSTNEFRIYDNAQSSAQVLADFNAGPTSTATPLPAAAWGGIVLLGGLGLTRLRRVKLV